MEANLFIVGIGPGDLQYLNQRAKWAIEESSQIVGYRLYLDLISQLTETKTLHTYALGEESLRAKQALELTHQGKTTALVCSGDPGIYAMASLVMEEMENNSTWNKIPVEIIPGISAVQILAARCGAPLGHDFCCISLSDLLTPWSIIERRIHAAGQGDFVVTFYNPVSNNRHWQLTSALDIMAQYRPASTPVVIGNNLSRDGESLHRTQLGDRKDIQANMLSIVLVGSRESRYHGDWLYTPRGYYTNGKDRKE